MLIKYKMKLLLLIRIQFCDYFVKTDTTCMHDAYNSVHHYCCCILEVFLAKLFIYILK